MSRRPLAIFALEGSRPFGERIAAHLATALAPHEERDFEDGEHKARPLQAVRGCDTYVVHSLHGDDAQSANDKLCRLLFFCGALRDSGAADVTAVIPYLCYARKDRRTKANDPITSRYVASLFEAMGVGRVITVEVHNVAAFENAFRCPTWHVECAPILAAHFAPLVRGGSVVAVSPDAGGAKRAQRFREELQSLTGQDVGSAFMEKSRSAGVVSGQVLAGDVRGATAIIVDDLISTGGTLVRAARACRAAGAGRVFAAAAHGLFMEGARELMTDSSFSGIVVANTVPSFRLARESVGQIVVVDATRAVANAIAACHEAS
ncbi:MAG: ribose-phosphate diphosphokinase [Reyranella sp.]